MQQAGGVLARQHGLGAVRDRISAILEEEEQQVAATRLTPGKPAGDGSGISGISDGVPVAGENLANAAR
eukprot:scaffold99513_cov69-Phaeocystis_antarctica.AAC.1